MAWYESRPVSRVVRNVLIVCCPQVTMAIRSSATDDEGTRNAGPLYSNDTQSYTVIA